MAKRSLLLVDGDARSLRVLEVSLRKAGFVVTTAVNGRDGLEKARVALPDLILSDTDMPEMDGFELCRAVKADPQLARVPFVFLTGQTEIENKIRGLELGVDEYLTKPIYIKEILTRIRLLLQKQQRDTIETRRDSNTRFAGTLHDMGVVDLIQTIEVGRKSGLIHFSGADGRQGTIYFRNGSVIDAEAGHLQGADAVYRLLTWSEGEFELLFRTVRRKDSIDTATPGLLMEGMRRLDEWGRLLEQLPPLTTRFEVDVAALAERLADLPDELNDILRLFDGRRSVLDVLDLARVGDLECLDLVSRLYFEELLLEVDGSADAGDSANDLGLEGWLGKRVPPTSELPSLEPAPGEIATDAAAEWDSSEGEPSVEEVWPSLAADDDEGPTPPSSRAPLIGMGMAGRDGMAGPASPGQPGAIALVEREPDGASAPGAAARHDAGSNGANSAPGANGTGPADAAAREDIAVAGQALVLDDARSDVDAPAAREEAAGVGAAPAALADPSAGNGEPRVEFRPGRTTGSFRPISVGEGGDADAPAVDDRARSSAAAVSLDEIVESAVAPQGIEPPGERPGAPGAAAGSVSSSGDPAAASSPDHAGAGPARVRTPSGGFSVVPPGDPSTASGRLHALSRGLDGDEPAAGDEVGPPDARAGVRARSPSGSHPVGGGAIGSVAVSVPGGLAGTGATGSIAAPTSRMAGGGTSILGRAPASLRPPPRSTPAGGAGPGDRVDQAFDTSDRTPLPDPVPLGEERSNPGIKSSFGAEVATVSGELAARYPRLTDDVGREMVGVAPLHHGERADRARAVDVRPGRADQRPSVELDQELSEAAEVVQVIARRRSSTAPGIGSGTTVADDDIARPRRRAAAIGAIGGDEVGLAMPVVPQAPRVSSMLRAASGRPFARTFVVTVAAATLVGALFGLLFWWLGSRDPASVAAGPAPTSASPAPAGARGVPVGSGDGSLPVAAPATEEGHRAVVATATESIATGEPRIAASSATGDPSAVSGDPSAASGDPSAASGDPSAASGDPSAASGDPSAVSGDPSAGSGDPSAVSGDPSAASGDPRPASEPAAPPAEVLGAADYDELYAQARQARRRRDYAAALDLATRAGRLDPTVQARTLQAEALLGLDRSARALVVVDDALKKKPHHAPAWYIKGRIHLALGQEDEARAALNEYLRLAPDGARADRAVDILHEM